MPVQQLPDATNRFLDAVSAIGFAIVPQVFSAGTRTSADAARAVGCELSAIAKSLVFMADDEAVLVLMPGDKRVDHREAGGLVRGRQHPSSDPR